MTRAIQRPNPCEQNKSVKKIPLPSSNQSGLTRRTGLVCTKLRKCYTTLESNVIRIPGNSRHRSPESIGHHRDVRNGILLPGKVIATVILGIRRLILTEDIMLASIASS